MRTQRRMLLKSLPALLLGLSALPPARLTPAAVADPPPAPRDDAVAHLLAALRRPGVDRTTADRLVLEFLKTDPTVRNLSRSLPRPVRDVIAAVEGASSLTGIGGSPFELSDEVAELRAFIDAQALEFSGILESTGHPVRYVPGYRFRNWGLTVDNVPEYTFVPTTKAGVCNVVAWAAGQRRVVRAAGYRHSWNDVFGADGGVLISMLQLEQVDNLPADLAPVDRDNQLQGCTFVGVVEGKGLVRVGASTTNQQFRDWMLSSSGGNRRWTLPLNVVLSEITLGGSISMICHGAGLRNQTISDLVAAVEFVNARGELQTVSDPELITAAAGAFGILGILTAITFRLDPMTYANMKPIMVPALLAVPPAPGQQVPPELAISVTDAQRDAAWREFTRRAEQDYYAEWFWFPYRPDVYVNTWSNDGPPAPSTPDYLDNVVHYLEEWLSTMLEQVPAWRAAPGRTQAEVLGAVTAVGLLHCGPDDPPVATPLIDAIHFRRGVRNWRVLDMEVEIPIPAAADGKPDWTVPARAWWEAINLVYSRPDAPMRVALEMRVMGGSSVDMSPTYGNTFGTCSIEVLTSQLVPQSDWNTFIQQLYDRWAGITGADGARLNVRPHWAKQWPGSIEGRRPAEYLREVAYAEQIPRFAAHVRRIAAAGGVDPAQLRERFANPLFDEILAAVYQ
ncbi:hypothetical protein ABIA39_005362 [Nocardia sp. GAS34]|uniref:FAD-binding protein n=1 Tax=unclassified Nocardia TaxID=2637762 RepID=UPI003D19FCCA